MMTLTDLDASQLGTITEDDEEDQYLVYVVDEVIKSIHSICDLFDISSNLILDRNSLIDHIFNQGLDLFNLFSSFSLFSLVFQRVVV